MAKGKKLQTKGRPLLAERSLKTFARLASAETGSVKKLMDHLREKLRDSDFFPGLPLVRENYRIRILDFEGTRYAIKRTGNFKGHGHNFEKLRKIFLVYQEAVRAGIIEQKHCRLSSIKVLGRTERYLVMQYVEGRPIKKPSKIYTELANNFKILFEKGLIDEFPQTSHAITTKDARTGKTVAYLPYDFI
ncbi:MAG: hypothetical protein ABIH20_02315 [Candidatus Diapherotrites archaeon]